MQNSQSILAQKAPLRDRKNRLRWLIAASSLPLFGMVAAFGIAPQTSTNTIPIQTVIEELALPAPATDSTAEDGFWREEKIRRGDTLASLLTRLNIDDQEAAGFLRSAKDSRMLRQLIPGRTIRAKTREDGELLSLTYVGSNETMLQVEKQGDSFAASDRPVPLMSRVMMKSGEIESSLYAATDATNLPDNIANQLADIFSSDIDFHRDLRKGDKFSVVYEAFYNQGELIKTGRVLAAEFVNAGTAYRAVYFQDKEGRGGYYTPEGKNLRKTFLRSPLEFSRISSGFTSSRHHPVLKEWRAHKGIDYAAPTGTGVRATADGTVAYLGRQNGYGNLLVLQHQGNFNTAYGHLSGFAQGLRKGTRVNQGDIIGYVGMTGLATGPHLHYEFRVAGVQRNPLAIGLPSALPIAAQYQDAFNKSARTLAARLDLLHGTNLASLD